MNPTRKQLDRIARAIAEAKRMNVINARLVHASRKEGGA